MRRPWADDDDPLVVLSDHLGDCRRRVQNTALSIAQQKAAECKECKTPWRYPRNIALENRIPAHPRVKPRTKATVIAHLATVPDGENRHVPVICKDLFGRVRLTHDRKWPLANALTREFTYDPEDGRVKYDIGKGGDRDELSYARLISLHSWLQLLGKTLIDVSLQVVDYYATLLLVMTIAIGSDEQMWEAFAYSKVLFMSAWLFFLVCSVLEAIRATWKEWNGLSSAFVGDLFEQCNAFERSLSFACLILMNLMQVSGEIKLLVTALHPWKSVQPFAAAKIDGARVFVVGYPNKAFYEVMNRSGQFRCLAIQLTMRTCLFSFKAYVATVLFMEGTPSWNMFFSCISSSFSLVTNWGKWWRLFMDRRALARKLLREVSASRERCEKDVCSPSCDKCTEGQKRQDNATRKILRHELQYSASAFPYSMANKNSGKECPRCGRDRLPERERLIPQEEPPLLEGQDVQLSEHYRTCHDAHYGPLKPGCIGRVLEVGPWIDARIGRRYLVETDDGSRFWYDSHALALVSPTPTTEDGSALMAEDAVTTLPGAPESNVSQLTRG
eukprot:TRINITY_DN55957_c0_g1_i1.p1 TRINITY_DN55957_c0_g1~~TRINITY_DN55957_c0_g1_i1.p1  ORF type:complete len:558 (-),score=85.30 TRINITY_DN55957_c0_g1_i1:12-1685(-)